ncbi:hypothetical protein FHT72_006668 [Rhizobium sp. BK077]|nr:hypothetical protein [Rhizobium sp. BK112]MBB3372134.1 hypothetical protein [Rhizobium sp. BK077]MBB4183286.1 hypothetical protein [Rhizobium sp. BK109]
MTDTAQIDRLKAEMVGLVLKLRNFARRFYSNHHDAEDLVQETLLKALANLDKFEEGTQLKSWVNDGHAQYILHTLQERKARGGRTRGGNLRVGNDRCAAGMADKDPGACGRIRTSFSRSATSLDGRCAQRRNLRESCNGRRMCNRHNQKQDQPRARADGCGNRFKTCP